ncbi:MAG: endonuclease, partial [FCB group bacterium]|nr:endonuclease [FCB group bacterium]
SGTVFEPADEYKGDFARTYFYMATRYYGEDGNWSDWAMSDGAELKPWTVEMLLDWHRDDPVSTKEINRNDAIYVLQNNRNPFIDIPQYVEYIWGDELPAPSALDATEIDTASFRANWSSVPSASFYKLYVSEDETFSTYLDAYAPKTLSANHASVSGLEAASDYYYKVKAVDGDKESDLSNIVHVQTVSASTAVAEIPFSYVIGFAYPNPFNSDCVLPIELDKEMHMEIDVLDLSGRVQKEIHNGILHAGDHKLTLHVGGLRSGIYFIRVQTPQRLHVRKVLFIK